ncbi:putative disease resistance RPP13-like protein 1 [Rutidosis leptorrhynchoides]|uniref:putative disease resistance RPP13-like protein 1 n=1 Tax=Rutidosis leptorrhynchoides TaxID=125765 RepID=UPI003A99E60B
MVSMGTQIEIPECTKSHIFESKSYSPMIEKKAPSSKFSKNVLPDDHEALSILAQHALGVRNFNLHPTFKLHGEGIMKKCDGLPLALKILPALRLSYYDLPPHVKHMFSYCCLFLKDYMFKPDELVLLWMAEGFLNNSNVSKEMKSIGRDCFKELHSRSFFQHSSNEKSRYTMHDLVIDSATSVAGEFFFMLGENMGIDDKNGVL